MIFERTAHRGHIKRCYYAPTVMLALQKLGGRARRRDVIAQVARILPLGEPDLERKGPRSQIHYVYMASKAREELVSQGLLKSLETVERGWWEFTDEGRRHVEKLNRMNA